MSRRVKQSESSTNYFPEDYFQAKYLGKTNNHLKRGNEYTIKITQDLFYRTYMVTIIYNKTTETEMDYSTEYSSRIGVENRWEVNYDK